jgi:hypothetical protein
MDDNKQFETMAAIRAYAQEIASQPANDHRSLHEAVVQI